MSIDIEIESLEEEIIKCNDYEKLKKIEQGVYKLLMFVGRKVNIIEADMRVCPKCKGTTGTIEILDSAKLKETGERIIVSRKCLFCGKEW